MTDTVIVDDPQRLRQLIGEPGPRAKGKVRHKLDDADARWLSKATLCFVATSDAKGKCDVSPKGDPAGSLVSMLDATTIAIAERPGNRRVDGYHNILQNPQVGMVFVIPGRSDVLRINGHALLVEDAPWFDDLTLLGRRPILALVVYIEEVFGHCAKALIRSQCWHPDTWRPGGIADVSATAREARAKGLAGPEGSAESDGVEELEQAQLAMYDAPLY